MVDPSFDRIVKSKLPILCLDTCVVLDLLRFPKDYTFGVSMHNAARQILRATERHQLVILIAHQVSEELENLLDETEQKTTKNIEELSGQINTLEAATAVYGEQRTTNLDHLDQYVIQARKVINSYLSVATLATPSEFVVGNAYARMNRGRPPARKAKDAINDYVIIETYLEIARHIRKGGHKQPIVFATSNIHDYAKPGSPSILKPDLDEEFDALSMEYAPNLAAVIKPLGV